MLKKLNQSFTIFRLAESDPEAMEILLNASMGHLEASRQMELLGYKVGESSIRKYRSNNNITLDLSAEANELSPKSGKAGKAEKTEDTFYSLKGDEGELSVGRGNIPVELTDNFDDLLVFFGLSPEHFEVLDDSVKVSKWQTSKRTESGDRDVIWLWSYKARFVRKSTKTLEALLDLQDAIDRAKARTKTMKYPKKSLGIGLGAPVTYAHVQGDEQTGKSEGGGLEGLRNREEQVLENSLNLIHNYMKRGINIDCILDSINGDRVENIFGHYPSQARTASTLRNQLDFAVDMDLARTEAFAALGLPIKKVYTPSNHGEIRQVIGQSPYTSESDNFDLIIGEMTQKIVSRLSFADQVDWFIPHDEPISTLVVSGVPVGVTHGHKVRGKISDWVLRQRDMRTFHDDFRMRILLMGHFHHFYAEDISGTTVIMTPTLDGGSPYFEAGYGDRSMHGALGLLISDSFAFGWSEITPI